MIDFNSPKELYYLKELIKNQNSPFLKNNKNISKC